ncbi:MAG: desulfoferrodoxin [Elusimicrobiales bacterium]|nr:desulfoferrodoxin [Elusimicrobiales bacterium]
MTKKNQVYKCVICGNIVEMLHAGQGELICCEKPMKLFIENSIDAAKEKHVPVIEKTSEGFKIKLGSIAHPMEEKHYIEWIELTAGEKSYKKFLNPGDASEAEFCIDTAEVTARAYCNLHGLWKSSIA